MAKMISLRPPSSSRSVVEEAVATRRKQMLAKMVPHRKARLGLAKHLEAALARARRFKPRHCSIS